MNSEYQDYELTAYLLGELEEDRAAELDEILAASPEARADLEEIRAAMDDVTGALASEPLPGLQPDQKAALETEFQKYSNVAVMKTREPRRFSRLTAAAVAACLLGVLVLSWDLLDLPGSRFRRDDVAMKQASVEAPKKNVPVPSVPALRVPEDFEKGSRVLAQPQAPAERKDKSRAEAGQKYEIDGVNTPSSRQAQVAKVDPPKFTMPAEIPKEIPPPMDDISEYSSMSGVTGVPGGVPGGVAGEQKKAYSRRAGIENHIDEARLSASAAGPINGRIASTSTHSGTLAMGAAGAEKVNAPAAREKAVMPRPGLTPPDFNTESYDFISDNSFTAVAKDPLSTFSIDVDTASYSNVRRFLDQGQLPPPDAVRIEELINYFPYDYEPPHGSTPFAVYTEVAQAPWAQDHRLVRIALKGKEFAPTERPAANLVFLLDVSGSMEPPNKLPLVRQAMRLLVERLEPRDHVAIVVYAGSSGLVLPSTSVRNKQRILDAIDQLEAGGSTNGEEGIRLAYQEALANFDRKGINRVILATDGDFNVGVTNQGELVRLVQDQAARGVFLTVLGFGMGNYKDSMLEKLADKGNGNYAYVDSLDEARKVLVEQMGGTLVTIAKDVKIQVEFNPMEVSAYRLIGYENRVMAHQDFDDDRKDAGDIGAGHTVTALYEVVPVGVPVDLPQSEPLKYQRRTPAATLRGELLTVKLRYKQPQGETSQKIEVEVVDSLKAFDHASEDFRLASAVAAFGMLLRNSPHKGSATYGWVRDTVDDSRQFDPQGYRADFLRLVREARSLGR